MPRSVNMLSIYRYTGPAREKKKKTEKEKYFGKWENKLTKWKERKRGAKKQTEKRVSIVIVLETLYRWHTCFEQFLFPGVSLTGVFCLKSVMVFRVMWVQEGRFFLFPFLHCLPVILFSFLFLPLFWSVLIYLRLLLEKILLQLQSKLTHTHLLASRVFNHPKRV